MRPAAFLAAALAWFGRYGTQGFALSIFLGLALPELAAAARPALPVTIFCFTTVVFMRLDIGVTLRLLRRPAKLAASVLWLLAGPVLLIGVALSLVGRGNLDPGIVLGLAIMAAAPPIMSSPAVAILYGFEPSLIIAGVVVATIASPITAPLLAELIAGAAVPLDRWVLTLRLLVFIGGGMAVAAAIRLWLGFPRIKAMKAHLDGFGMLTYVVFAIAAMDGVTAAALGDPGLVLAVLASVFAVAAAGLASGLMVLWRLPAAERFMISYGTGQRNMGLLVAALGAGVSPKTYLFFALAQFPIYLLPWLLRGVAARIRRREAGQDCGRRPGRLNRPP
ncbi:sodium:proton symporter [Bosea sp. (in: a-proteobacteria)]|uniref:sodium:proton symporter n=1 Tax=Bosea sp. (in: a-proteobacteria) TaxID=1871050 RepID=UPI00260DD0C0|nr:sodium:proton symporter [Bosea sp. (in: a-proteobacteria)]MCO5092223.1 sodium:proton symporter [Bosea sp. (in: a-proteobacteria)]